MGKTKGYEVTELLHDRYFFEIPIYRISQGDFDKKYSRDLKKRLEIFSKFKYDGIEDTVLHATQHFWETYGGPWHYNQVIGWVRLYILGTQIRGELYWMAGKRFSRKTRNQIRLLGKAFEAHVFPNYSSEQILTRVEQELRRLQKEYHRKGRTMDLECFQVLAASIDWRKLVDTKNTAKTHWA